MAIRDDFTAGEVLAAADLNDTFAAKLNLAGGKVLQVVRATDTTQRTTTSTSYVDVTGMSVTITPQKNTSALLIIATGATGTAWSTGADQYGEIRLTDSSNNTLSGSQSLTLGLLNVSIAGAAQFRTPFNIIGYSTPATTSAVTYKMRFKSQSASTTLFINNNESTGQMYAIEVSA
jgi:hypothetical protein